MADLTNAVASGFDIGQKVGGKYTGLQSALDVILARLKQRQDNQDSTNLLGVQGLLSGKDTGVKEGTPDSISGIIPGVGLQPNDQSNTVYQQSVDDKGNPVLTPVGSIKKGSKVLPIKAGMASKDLEEAAQLLASGQEAPGQLSGFSKQKQQVLDRAKEINPDFNVEQADLAFSAQKSEMTNARIQAQKVNQANTLMATLTGNYDPKTDTFNIPPSQHTEIAMGLARLLSPQGQVSENLTNQLQQGTLHQKLADVAIYFGADPSITSGPTQSLIKFLQKQIDIQGTSSQTMLTDYSEGISPTYKSIKAGQSQGNSGQTSSGLTYTVSQ